MTSVDPLTGNAVTPVVSVIVEPVGARSGTLSHATVKDATAAENQTRRTILRRAVIDLNIRSLSLVVHGRSFAVYHSAYFEPSSAVRSEPLFTSNTPACAVGLFGSGSDGTVCQELVDLVNGSSGILRRYPSVTRASRLPGYCPLSA